ncbi:tumor necrosis factor receptor superfamily member 14-like isoform X2 [Solea solea]|uniref:tumor necrosis factor receptor superfamily member 14-like isoform X2 n=1 Tax=Solea solea TaxID=90069 RepID=UPI002729DBC1|nr:tumor necrosis factor receptor superfamily member 14-like isoform X2 [Solea solea]
MLSVSLLFGLVVGLIVPGSCCQEKEYKSRDGDCCSKCDEGQFVLKDCTDVRSTRCNRCKDGTFMNQPNGLNMCFPCTSCVSGNGLFVKQACTASTDTVCDVLSGYMCRDESSSTGCSRAEKHSSCVSGQQIKEPGARSPTPWLRAETRATTSAAVNCSEIVVGVAMTHCIYLL